MVWDKDFRTGIQPAAATAAVSQSRETSAPTVQLPGWLLSLALHAGLLLLAASRLASCSDGSPGAADGDWRSAGIVPRAEASLSDSTTDSDADTEPTDARELASTAPAEVPQAPPADLALPAASALPTIGPGGAVLPGQTTPNDLANLSQPNGLRPADLAAGEGGHGETSFFDIPAQGSRFVYLVDCSGSMMYGRLRAAKVELLRSLQALDRTQQFQIIFYNTTPRSLNLRNTREPQMYWATEINQTLARQFVASARPESGTKHMPALSLALSFQPDVLFFLTDADNSLEAGELDEVRRMNGGRAKIHCIEFGTAIAPSTGSFLKKLSRLNDGSYRYVDVKQFR